MSLYRIVATADDGTEITLDSGLQEMDVEAAMEDARECNDHCRNFRTELMDDKTAHWNERWHDDTIDLY